MMIAKMEKVEISHRTIIFTVFFLISLLFVYQIRGLILFLFLCLIFTTALGPVVDRLERLGLPRGIAIVLLYLVIIGVLAYTIASTIPVFVSQTSAFINNLPQFLEKIGFFDLQIKASDYSDQLTKLPANLFKIVSSAFSNILGLATFLVINYYLLIERKNLRKHLHYLFADSGKQKAEAFVLELEKKLGGWVRAEIILMVVVGLMSYIGLRLLDVDFALPLALVAGFLELVPNIGPILSMVPALIVGFATSSAIGLAVTALYFLIQQVENNFIVPLVMRKTVNLHPLITILALMIGLRIGGIGGSLLSVPVVLFIRVVIEQFYLPSRSRPEEKLED